MKIAMAIIQIYKPLKWQILWATAEVFVFVINCSAQQSLPGSTPRWAVPWHVTNATLRFRIEKDIDYTRVPDVHLAELEPTKGSFRRRSFSSSGEKTKLHFRVNNKIYTHGVRMFSPTRIIYNIQKNYDRFVALGVMEHWADSNANVVFEVYADEKLLYQSEQISKGMPPVHINVNIPPKSKQLKLVTTGSVGKQRRWAAWINAGFLLKGRRPKAAVVKIWTPTYDPTKFDVIVVSASGTQVHCRSSAPQAGEPTNVFFDTSKGGSVFYVYLTPRQQKKNTRTTWQPQAGLLLETRRVPKIDSRCNKLPGLVKLWYEESNPVCASLIERIHHALPVHRSPVSSNGKPVFRGGLALYYCTGFFHTEQPGEYIFATNSNWGSYLFIDNNLVVSWPGRHNNRGGRRGEYQGRSKLNPGVHKLEYVNCSPWGRMFIMAAWQRPRDNRLFIMTRGDFLPVDRYIAGSIGYRKSNAGCGSFEWRTIDDLRSNGEETALVAFQFKALPAENQGGYSYRWTFDDGEIKTGPSVEHVFLKPGMRKVTLDIMRGKNSIASPTENIYVHSLWDKVDVNLKNIAIFEKGIFQRNHDLTPVSDLINLYRFAERIDKTAWKQQTATFLVKRLDELIEDNKNGSVCLGLGRDLQSVKMRRYDDALKVFSSLGNSENQDKSVHYRALLSQAELLLYYFGQASQSREILRKLQKENEPDDKLSQRCTLLYAETLLAMGKLDEARRILQITPRLRPTETDNEKTLDIRHLGMLRHARQMVENKEAPQQLQYAGDNIETIVTEDPMKLLWPSLHLIRLDIYLAQKEYLIALNLSDYLIKLELSEQDRAETLARRVEALCGMRKLDQAKTVYDDIMENYPFSAAVNRAKKAIVKAVSSR